jgi:transcriptional regulator with XRE-family HTH domain
MSAAECPTPYRELAVVVESVPMLLREARRARGLSLRATALQIGVSFNTVKRVEDGEDPRGSSLAAILRWLDLTNPPRQVTP